MFGLIFQVICGESIKKSILSRLTLNSVGDRGNGQRWTLPGFLVGRGQGQCIPRCSAAPRLGLLPWFRSLFLTGKMGLHGPFQTDRNYTLAPATVRQEKLCHLEQVRVSQPELSQLPNGLNYCKKPLEGSGKMYLRCLTKDTQ